MLTFLTVRRFATAKSGLAAIEFAMLLPVMIVLFFGIVEVSLALSCRAAVTNLASTVADLVAQKSVMTGADISDVYGAANTILYPYFPNFTPNPNQPPTIRITSVRDDGSGIDGKGRSGIVDWTCLQAGSGTLPNAAPVANQSYALGQALMTSGGSVIIAEIAFDYRSPTMQIVTGTTTMTQTFYTKPRRVQQIPKPACS